MMIPGEPFLLSLAMGGGLWAGWPLPWFFGPLFFAPMEVESQPLGAATPRPVLPRYAWW